MKYSITYILIGFLFINYLNAQPSKENIYEALSFISKQLEHHDIIAIGETHDKVQVTDFYIQLIQQEKFREQVDYIVIEMGNHLFQAVLNQYIKGEEVEQKELYKLWRDHTSCMLNGSDNTAMIRLLKAIREVNLNSSKKIKVLAGDPPIDWTKITCINQFYKYLGNRDQFYAQLVIDKIVKAKKKALLIMGNGHFNKLRTESMIKQELQNPITEILQTQQAKLFLINILSLSSFPYAKLSSLDKGSIILSKDTWLGNLELGAPFIKDKKLKNQTDAILYLGKREELSRENITEFNDPNYQKELEKRNQLKSCN